MHTLKGPWETKIAQILLLLVASEQALGKASIHLCQCVLQYLKLKGSHAAPAEAAQAGVGVDSALINLLHGREMGL